MIKILICDDDTAFLEFIGQKVRSILDQLGRQAQVHLFQYAEEMPKNLLEECDIAFLDIDFTGRNYNGIDIARQIRNFRQNAVVILATNFAQYAPEGYEVQAFRYLLKNDIDIKLKPYLIQALEQHQNVKQTLQINVAGEHISIALEKILYIESELHMVNVHVLKSNRKENIVYRYYSTISSLEADLSQHGFLRVHRSYLVNMMHIKKYQCKEVMLSTNLVLKASEKNYAAQKKKYLLWKGKQ